MSILRRLEDFAESVDADVSIGRKGYGGGGDWVVMVNYGHEAPDSPMVGASALGNADTLEHALEQALGEAGCDGTYREGETMTDARVSAGGRELPEGYTVKYVHSRVVEPHPEFGTPVLLPTGGDTIAKVLDPDGEQIAEGEAHCRPDENFNRALGREIALGRALLELFPREPLAPGARRYDPEGRCWR